MSDPYVDGCVDPLGQNIKFVDSEARSQISDINASLTHYMDISISINTTDTGRTKVVASGVPTGNKLVSIEPIYDNDLYYYTSAKGMPIISIREDVPTSISVMASQGSSLADTVNRTLKMRVGYVKI